MLLNIKYLEKIVLCEQKDAAAFESKFFVLFFGSGFLKPIFLPVSADSTEYWIFIGIREPGGR